MLSVAVGELWESCKETLNARPGNIYKLAGENNLSSSGAYRSRDHDLIPGDTVTVVSGAALCHHNSTTSTRESFRSVPF